MTVTADDVDTALGCATAVLEPATARDWSVLPGTGEWDSWRTAEHIGDCLLSYAGQLVVQPRGRYVRFLAHVNEDASSAEAWEFAVAGGLILVATLRSASPDVRGYHPSGIADPSGFAAMGCVEALVHAQDIAVGLGLTLDPPADLCARVLGRLFPDVDVADPWTSLLWATGRVELPGLGLRTEWHWRPGA